MSEFKDIIFKLRTERGFTQGKLADELGTSKSTVGMWEMGERYPSKELYEAIADYFNVDMDYLYGRSDVRKKVQFDKDGTEYAPIDSDLSIIQRERNKMSDKEKTKLMNILRANFDDYNWEEDDSGDIE
ncbi:MAG: helix-turn-helix domain-containing protein [Lachnospiraceae bacterium]|nr:helix-turn-helix domain-containing protein [Lachnospiraceae bacterium]